MPHVVDDRKVVIWYSSVSNDVEVRRKALWLVETFEEKRLKFDDADFGDLTKIEREEMYARSERKVPLVFVNGEYFGVQMRSIVQSSNVLRNRITRKFMLWRRQENLKKLLTNMDRTVTSLTTRV